MNYKGSCKTWFAFESAIIKLFELCNNKKPYNNYNFSSSRSLAYYVNINSVTEHIDNKKMAKIYKDYYNYLKIRKTKINELKILSDSESENYKIDKYYDKENDYSSNIHTESDSSSEEIISNINNSISDDENNSDRMIKIKEIRKAV